ncbi:MAG: TIGR03960 family B12-binding radical SAM protein [candidate division KSB1 bacterium]|nr:TIGR03960 family B12-binding radical SAM protein [candidate division KSB1 bacterium]
MQIDRGKLERILPLVSKPGRYVGGEPNAIVKDDAAVDLRVALVFPDVYEVGMSYLGYQILYHILNREEWIAAERVYAPWVDMEARMRQEGIPLYSLETKRPLAQFEVIGFTLQYELHYTNILNLLDLAGIPLRSAERRGLFPLVIGGGPNAFHPEPLAPFFDLFLIGDAEESFLEVLRLVRIAKHEDYSREVLLKELAGVPGVYVPSLYEEIRGPDGGFRSLEPIEEGVPPVIQARQVRRLEPEFYPDAPVVPLIEATHDRLSVEIMRGCTRGCRFCNAGILYRPVRERPVPEVAEHIRRALDNTGYEEVSLVSLSTSDYSGLPKLLAIISPTLRDRMVNLSFPSLRPETFTPEIAAYARDVRKSGLTFAPEAGTERLRSVINKLNTNEDLLRAVDLAFAEGWDLVKLYFMIGLPTETPEDLQGIVDLIGEVVRLGRKHGGNRRVHVSISPFVPKPHTPFQWERQLSLEETRERIRFLLEHVRWPSVKLSWREAEVCQVEGLLARGDRRVAEVIEAAWRRGATHDAWSECFRYERWAEAVAACGLSFEEYTRARKVREPLPWQHISKGVSRRFLERERARALRGESTPDCKDGLCNACGLMEEPVCREIIARSKARRGIAVAPVQLESGPGSVGAAGLAMQYGRDRRRVRDVVPPTPTVYRIHYARGEALRFVSHRDVIRAFERAFRRAGLPLAYSQGFNPRPKISCGPALPLGVTSDAEYLDVTVESRPAGDLASRIRPFLPAGLEIRQITRIAGRQASLSALVNRLTYEVTLDPPMDPQGLSQQILSFLARKEIIVQRKRTGGGEEEEAKEVDIRPFVESIQTLEKGKKLRIVLKVREGRTARVHEVLQELLGQDAHEVLRHRIHRTGIFVAQGHRLLSPMEL